MTTRAQGTDGTPTGVMQRAALILDALDGAEPLNLSQISAATRLPLSSTHRALEQLMALRWVHRVGKDYQLGMRLLELGSAAHHQNVLRSAALPSLHRLHRTTGCIVHLGVLDGDEAVYLEKVGGELAVGVRSGVGLRIPARSSAIGKALLAGSSNTTAPDGSGAREAQVVCEHERCMKGFSCLAIPIGPVGDGETAAISVFGSAAKLRTDHRIRLSVRTAAADIARRMALAQRP
ncbi:IclR family transcriptional regulator [Streptomyces xanthii]|uniref:Helix-turn-helix domain-containing protein n=1 Tax=Streptomyces xanthii TaxID=2768069 RepID=A0A7H1BHY5_9ACTN|nr:helix-turn-helix domain-containing protein [Streptomyces xanthii]QNS08340.1 helix-turn-helix domain-containing protein [Streptomyces xanthii]